MNIPWTDKVSNEEVLTRAGVQRKMIREMLIRQLKFMGQITRNEGLENLALTGKIIIILNEVFSDRIQVTLYYEQILDHR